MPIAKRKRRKKNRSLKYDILSLYTICSLFQYVGVFFFDDASEKVARVHDNMMKYLTNKSIS